LNTIKFSIVCLSFFLATSSVKAQFSYFEIGGGLGLSNYNGDMSRDEVASVIGSAKFSAIGYARYNLTPFINFKMGLTYGRFGADDSKADTPGILRRNLSFVSNIYEASLTTEINILKYDPVYSGSIFTIYAMGGIAGFHFDPTTVLDGQKYRLQPIGTEGQGLPQYPDKDFYSLYQFSIPFGGGLKVRINESFNFITELSWRLTFTDYLDDLSTTYPDYSIILAERGPVAADLSHRYTSPDQGGLNGSIRGNPDVRDYYFTIHAGISYNLLNLSSTPGARRIKRKSRTSKCPKF
jgi:hypothetical protein